MHHVRPSVCLSYLHDGPVHIIAHSEETQFPSSPAPPMQILQLSRLLIILTVWHVASCSGYLSSLWSRNSHNGSIGAVLETRQQSINHNSNGTPFVWLPVDEYSGSRFFELVRCRYIRLDSVTHVLIADGISSQVKIQQSASYLYFFK